MTPQPLPLLVEAIWFGHTFPMAPLTRSGTAIRCTERVEQVQKSPISERYKRAKLLRRFPSRRDLSLMATLGRAIVCQAPKLM